jgi:hypothetical protein
MALLASTSADVTVEHGTESYVRFADTRNDPGPGSE